LVLIVREPPPPVPWRSQPPLQQPVRKQCEY
jgi:hypothetical protein